MQQDRSEEENSCGDRRGPRFSRAPAVIDFTEEAFRQPPEQQEEDREPAVVDAYLYPRDASQGQPLQIGPLPGRSIRISGLPCFPRRVGLRTGDFRPDNFFRGLMVQPTVSPSGCYPLSRRPAFTRTRPPPLPPPSLSPQRYTGVPDKTYRPRACPFDRIGQPGACMLGRWTPRWRSAPPRRGLPRGCAGSQPQPRSTPPAPGTARTSRRPPP
jgi:hypothetical protein